MTERFFILSMPRGVGVPSPKRGAWLYDRARPDEMLAALYDPEIAARIVRLLNADVARTEKQGAVAP